jgi:cellulose synthase/poly-beta-1,6-N-acetylglucosamine synthase-like glycosyltransferase
VYKLLFLVFARDRNHVSDKIKELEDLGVQYRIICGEHFDHPYVVYRAPNGKYDAINFGAGLIPRDVDIVAMNDVDTVIHNFHFALRCLEDEKVALVFGTEMVKEGPQNLFFRILNPIRKKIQIAASGELMLIRHEVLKKTLPLKPCKAEDTYILFKVLEHGYKTVFCDDCYAETERTKTAEKEVMYKRKTVTGIYQSLSYTRPPYPIRVFYVLLPFSSPILLVLGKKGYFWMKGILLGLTDYLRGDKTGAWQTTYMK